MIRTTKIIEAPRLNDVVVNGVTTLGLLSLVNGFLATLVNPTIRAFSLDARFVEKRQNIQWAFFVEYDTAGVATPNPFTLQVNQALTTTSLETILNTLSASTIPPYFLTSTEIIKIDSDVQGYAKQYVAFSLRGSTYVPMIFTVDTTKISTGSTAATHFKLPLVATGQYAFIVDWGDSTTSLITAWNDPAVEHTYSASGIYTVTITGTCWGWKFNGTGDKLKPKVLSQWGNGWRFINSDSHWEGCTNLTITATDTPNMTGAEQLLYAFKSCSLLTGLGNQAWDISKITGITDMFANSPLFNQDLGSWDVSNVLNSSGTFRSCTAFNNGGSDAIKNWDVSKCTDFSDMFAYAEAFNQPIGSWDMGAATNLWGMFNVATEFNQPIGSWDTSKVTNIGIMFAGAINFDQDIGDWDVSGVQHFYNVFFSPGMKFNNGGSDSIKNWKPASNAVLYGTFRHCYRFNQPVGDWPIQPLMCAYVFAYCTAFNQPIYWDVSKVTSFAGMFRDCTSFNSELPWGQVGAPGLPGSPTSAEEMFIGCTVFNQPIGSWDVGNLNVFRLMLAGCEAFNQPLGSWDVSNATNMAGMFQSASVFNNGGSDSIKDWNVEAVTNFATMFSVASAFKQSVGAWWPREASGGFADMFQATDMNVGGSPTNLVTNAQDFTSVNWTKNDLSATVNTATAPDGSVTANSLTPSVADSTDHSVGQTKTVVNGTAYTVRVALKASQLTWGQLICSGAITANVYVNLSTGAIESSTGSVSVTDIGSGWYVLEITGTASTTSLTIQIKAWNNATGTSFAGNASDAIFAWQASMFAPAGKSLDNYSNFLKDITGWTGSGDGAATRTGVTSAAVAVGGSGYAVGDVLTVVGGTLGAGTKLAEVKVATIDGAGAVLTVTVKRGCGNYDTQPANAAATTGGTGNGCTLTLTWGSKFAGLPTSKAFHGGLAKYSMVDCLAINARKNLVLAVGSGGKGWTITDSGPI